MSSIAFFEPIKMYLMNCRCDYRYKKSGVALTQLSLTLHYSRRVFYFQFYIHVKSFFLCFIVDELPAFIVIGFIF